MDHNGWSRRTGACPLCPPFPTYASLAPPWLSTRTDGLQLQHRLQMDERVTCDQEIWHTCCSACRPSSMGTPRSFIRSTKLLRISATPPPLLVALTWATPCRSQLTRQLLDPINLFGVDHSLLVRQAAQVAGDQFVMDAIGLHAWRRLSLKLSWNAVADSAGRSARDASPPGAETWGQGRLEIMVGFATPGRALPRTDHKRAEGRQQGRSPTGDQSTAAYPD